MIAAGALQLLGTLGGLVVTVLLGVIANELHSQIPRLARQIVRLTTRFLPPDIRHRHSEEWLEHVDSLATEEKKLFALVWAMGCLRSASAMRLRAFATRPLRSVSLLTGQLVQVGVSLALIGWSFLIAVPALSLLSATTGLWLLLMVLNEWDEEGVRAEHAVDASWRGSLLLKAKSLLRRAVRRLIAVF